MGLRDVPSAERSEVNGHGIERGFSLNLRLSFARLGFSWSVGGVGVENHSHVIANLHSNFAK